MIHDMKLKTHTFLNENENLIINEIKSIQITVKFTLKNKNIILETKCVKIR